MRRWLDGDAEALRQAVAESVDHLRPWMPWIANEPLTLEGRRRLIAEWEQHWLDGGDVLMGVFIDGVIAGGCGLHPRIAPDGLEIGYWTRVSHLRQGVASTAARLLTDLAFTLDDITHVEIHHDKANAASGTIPRKLGYRLVKEAPDRAEAPSEIGISCDWRVTREEWRQLPWAGRSLTTWRAA